jgi:orc1/cdc6 family replication initiation protein
MLTNARVLQPEFVPNDLVHRNQEIHHLTAALRPLTEGCPAQNSFLSGPSGAGKTCIARYAVEELQEAVLDLDTQYVNCWEDYTRFKLLYRVLEGLDRAFDIHRQSTATDSLLTRLREIDLDPYVIVLDEVDQLQDDSALYDLQRIPGITLILIANQEESFYSSVDERVASRLRSSATIRFDSYTDDELVSILDDRVKWGLRPDSIDPETVEIIASAAAGDARVAINILRSAASRAQQNGEEVISESTVAAVTPAAKEEIRQKNIERLTPDQQHLYEILDEHGELSIGTVYERYQERAADPKTKRMVRNYLSKMAHYNIVRPEGDNRGRTYELV